MTRSPARLLASLRTLLVAGCTVAATTLAGCSGRSASSPGRFTPTDVQTGVGPDTLVLQISEDAWANGDGTSDDAGDADFDVSVDGVAEGSFTASAAHSVGQTQAFTFHGSWGGGAHTVDVTFTNDAWGGTPDTDRNLYVDSITLDGNASTPPSAALYSNGDQAFTVGGGAYGTFIAQYESFPTKLYVSPSGADSGACSSSAPCKTINYAASLIKWAGAVVYVADGVYPTQVVTSASGSASAHVAYVSQNKWGAKINVPSFQNGIWVNSGSYVDIVGFDVQGAGSRLGIWIGESSSSSAGSYTRVAFNNVHDMGYAAGGAGGGAIGDGNSYVLSGIEIFNNLVHDVAPYPSKSSTVHAIYLQNNGDKAYNNLVYRVCDGISSDHAATNLVITNNVVFESPNTGIALWGGSSPGTPDSHGIVANNIVVDTAYALDQGGTADSTNVYENNLLYANTNDTYGTISSSQLSANITGKDPLFINYQSDGSGDYHLQASSPGVDSGTSSGAPSFDLEGTARPKGNGYDIGAYER